MTSSAPNDSLWTRIAVIDAALWGCSPSGARGWLEKLTAGRPGFDEYPEPTAFFLSRPPRSAS